MNQAGTSILARRATGCKGWRWLPGMLTDCGERVTDPSVFYLGTLPDLTDPATLGCLLALVREVVQDPGLHVRCMLPYAPDMSGRTPPPWLLYSGRGARWGDRHDTEAEALVVALETAP